MLPSAGGDPPTGQTQAAPRVQAGAMKPARSEKELLTAAEA